MTGFEATRRKDGDSEKDSWLEESEAGRLVRARTSLGLSNEQLSIAVRRECRQLGQGLSGLGRVRPARLARAGTSMSVLR